MRKFEENEIWKDIKGYEGFYQISNLGNIKSLKTWTGSKYIDKSKILKGSITKYGYKHLIIKRKHYCVHRLVAEAFIPNPQNYPIVNHIDGNKLNNNSKNLEWCGYSYNEKEAYRIGIKKPKKTRKILQYDKNDNFIREWLNLSEINKQTQYCISNIFEVCKNKRKTAYGCKWKYKE